MAKPIEKNKKKYMEYVQKKLKKYKVNDPSKVPNKFKKKFFTELDKGWESKEEKKKKKKAEDKDSWVKDVQEEVKEKQKGEKPSKPVVKIEKEALLEGHAKDWKSALERIVTAVRDIISYKPPKGLFKEPGTQIAKQLLADAKSPAQAMQRLNFYINRAGSNLSEKDQKHLEAAKRIISEAIDKGSKKAGFWTQKILTHKNMSKIKNLILDMKEDLMGEDYSEEDGDKFLKDFVHTIDPLVADMSKKAPKQPPKGWWDKMHKDIKNKNPEYDKKTLDKIVGDIWYNKMKGPKKKEVMDQFEG